MKIITQETMDKTEEQNKIMEDRIEYMRKMGITRYHIKRDLWMKRSCKYRRQNHKYQGAWQTDWKKIENTKRR